MKYLLLVCLFPIISFAQTQIGSDVDGEAAGDLSGYSVALSLDGSVIAIGSHRNSDNGFLAGHVRVFQVIAGTWEQVGDNIDGENAGDQSGWSLSLSTDGNVVAIGSIGNDGNGNSSGHVKVYQNSADIWTQVGSNIEGENAFDQSGFSVSLSADGNVVAIGAITNNGTDTDAGHVKVYQNNSGTWTQIGLNIDGEAAGDLSGGSVSLSADGSILSIGAIGSNDNTGQVRVYENVSGSWIQTGMAIDGEATDDESGESVSMSSSGDSVAIGAPKNDGSGNDAGHVRVYKNNDDTWEQVGTDIDGKASDDLSGSSVSLSADGEVVAIGSPGNSENSDDAGHARMYELTEGTWTQKGLDVNGEAALDYSGLSVFLSADGTTLAVGARGNDGYGSNSGHVRVYDVSNILSSNSFVQTNFMVHPNPSSKLVNIQLNEGLQLENIHVYSALGQLIKTEQNAIISVSELAKGSYFFQVTTNKGKATKTVIVQ